MDRSKRILIVAMLYSINTDECELVVEMRLREIFKEYSIIRMNDTDNTIGGVTNSNIADFAYDSALTTKRIIEFLHNLVLEKDSDFSDIAHYRPRDNSEYVRRNIIRNTGMVDAPELARDTMLFTLAFDLWKNNNVKATMKNMVLISEHLSDFGTLQRACFDLIMLAIIAKLTRTYGPKFCEIEDWLFSLKLDKSTHFSIKILEAILSSRINGIYSIKLLEKKLCLVI